MINHLVSQIKNFSEAGKELCIAFPDGENEPLWVRFIKDRNKFYIDSANSYDSSAFPSETAPLLREVGIKVEIEPLDVYYGFHAIVSEEQFLTLISTYPVVLVGSRDMIGEGSL